MIMKLSSAKACSFRYHFPHQPFNRLVTQTRCMHLINAYLPSHGNVLSVWNFSHINLIT